MLRLDRVLAALALLGVVAAGWSYWQVRSAIVKGALLNPATCLSPRDAQLREAGLVPAELRERLVVQQVARSNGWLEGTQARYSLGLAISQLGLKLGYPEARRAELGEAMLARMQPCAPQRP